MLSVNQRVVYKNALHIIVAVTPRQGGTEYRIKNVQTDVVVPEAVSETEVSVVDFNTVIAYEQEMHKQASERLRETFGDGTMDSDDLRLRKIAELRKPVNVKIPDQDEEDGEDGEDDTVEYQEPPETPTATE